MQIQFIIGAVVLGLLNTSRTQAWLLVYLHFYPEWKAKVLQEMNDLLAAHDATPENLHTIPFPAWESALPSLEACTSEIIRLLADTSLFRKNMGGEVDIGGRTLPAQSILIYPISVSHFNPDFFPDPMQFDPSRITHKNPHFVGWGVGLFFRWLLCVPTQAHVASHFPGKHPCTGRRTALMLLKLVTTHFLLRFHYDLVDGSGNALKNIPQRERNTLHMPESAKGEEVFIKYTSVSNFGSAI
jgi:cytochrome P450